MQTPDPQDKSLFERALIASRLVDAATLGQIGRTFRPSDSAADIDRDVQLADELIRRELLNPWQVEQLRAGRTKFTLGPYLILDAIGKGGMGHVFKGQHDLLGRVDAVKVLPRARTSPQSIASFQHEMRAQAQLDHPNLVRVNYADKDGDTYYLVTEYVPGVDLRRLVRRMGPLPVECAASVVSQTADALEHAHRRGLVHRDVKPGNLLVRPDGVVKITDLGLAWFLSDSAGASPVGKNKIAGTSDYLAPEVIENPERIFPVSDVYALGCTLYYSLTGKVPYPGGNTAEKMRRHQEDTPIDPRVFKKELPAALVELVTEMMHKDHNQRTPSAAAVVERLAEFITPDASDNLAKIVAACEEGGPLRIVDDEVAETLDSYTGDHLTPTPAPASPANRSPGTPANDSNRTASFHAATHDTTTHETSGREPTTPAELAEANAAQLAAERHAVLVTAALATTATVVILAAAIIKALE